MPSPPAGVDPVKLVGVEPLQTDCVPEIVLPVIAVFVTILAGDDVSALHAPLSTIAR